MDTSIPEPDKEQASEEKHVSVSDPNILVYDFLKQNNLRMKTVAVDPEGGFTGDGFLLVDRPILKVIFERI